MITSFDKIIWYNQANEYCKSIDDNADVKFKKSNSQNHYNQNNVDINLDTINK